MNMFKSRRKAKDSEPVEVFSSGQPASTPPKGFRNLKRKNKHAQAEFKPVFDLTTALPDTDDFRTSLLMPKLSARFSMLREQDDPSTKVGKASDDSVLFPKRASRLNLFSPSPLTDIHEVESVYSTFRPPFADRERSSSVGDGYDSDGGSVMSRARPGEGNTLFGGRQKIYRLATGSTRNLASDADGAADGREHDTSISQFHQYRKNEKDALALTTMERNSVPVVEEGNNSEIASPATAFSKNRGTQSSTNSNAARSSTAATSVTSDSLVFRNSGADNTVTKGHESVLPTPENLAAISIPKTREEAIPNRFFSQSRSVIPDKPLRPTPMYGASMRNASSPPVVATAQPLDFGFKTESRSVSATGRYQTGSSASDVGDVLANNVQPNDRGKATAMGMFNKPAREFDEHQFNQRQLQMHEEHVSTMSTNSRSTSQASNDTDRTRQNSIQNAANAVVALDDRISMPQMPSMPSVPASPVPNSTRASKASERSIVPRPRSRSTTSTTAVANVKARVESLIRKQNTELAALEHEKMSGNLSENKENYAEAFFDNEDDEESDFDGSSHPNSSRVHSTQIDESHIHPAFRNSYRVSDIRSRKSNHSNLSKTKSYLDDERRESSKVPVSIIEPQQPEVGLSGLIRTHLRQNSDKSSIMLEPGVAPAQTEQSRTTSTISLPKPINDYSESNASEVEATQNLKAPSISDEPPTPTLAMSQIAQQFLSQAIAIKDAAERERAENAAQAANNPFAGFDFTQHPYQDDLEPTHQRSESSETTKERREFDEKLAQRQRKIREGLRSVKERERSQSPATVARGQQVAMQAFIQQRAATDPQPKALKLLGLRSVQPESNDDDRARNATVRSETRGRMPETNFQPLKQTAMFARFPEPGSERHQSPRPATPPALRHGRGGERSHSSLGDRSRSRTRRDANPPPPPHMLGTFNNWNHPSPSPPIEEPHSKSDSSLATYHGYRGVRSPPPNLVVGLPARPSPKPSPISPQNSNDSPFDSAGPSPSLLANDRSTSSNDKIATSNGRTTPNAFIRKRSVTKTMISEPTFVSSTSSVPLVHLPGAQQGHATSVPPLPTLNPRRRGNTLTDRPVMSPVGPGFAFSRSPLEPVPASPVVADFGSETMGRKSPSPRKLRKANSEGGSMAAKARQQAIAADLADEKLNSPALPVFPNRSATALGVHSDGAMF